MKPHTAEGCRLTGVTDKRSTAYLHVGHGAEKGGNL